MKHLANNLKIKVCGMTDTKNILSVAELQPDFLGFIFFRRSPRNAFQLSETVSVNLPDTIEKVGVFVNADIKIVSDTCRKYAIKTLQLHGDESPEFCSDLRNKGFSIIKSFGLADTLYIDVFNRLSKYKDAVDLFLFDTSGKNPGGNGLKFNWNFLEHYSSDIPFILSGGIGPEDVEKIKSIKNKYLFGVDLNSKFEIQPGIKDIGNLSNFITQLRN